MCISYVALTEDAVAHNIYHVVLIVNGPSASFGNICTYFHILYIVSIEANLTYVCLQYSFAHTEDADPGIER
jgi:hypothetical protein